MMTEFSFLGELPLY